MPPGYAALMFLYNEAGDMLDIPPADDFRERRF
jgi:hypothetical protein